MPRAGTGNHFAGIPAVHPSSFCMAHRWAPKRTLDILSSNAHVLHDLPLAFEVSKTRAFLHT